MLLPAVSRLRLRLEEVPPNSIEVEITVPRTTIIPIKRNPSTPASLSAREYWLHLRRGRRPNRMRIAQIKMTLEKKEGQKYVKKD